MKSRCFKVLPVFSCDIGLKEVKGKINDHTCLYHCIYTSQSPMKCLDALPRDHVFKQLS